MGESLGYHDPPPQSLEIIFGGSFTWDSLGMRLNAIVIQVRSALTAINIAAVLHIKL